MIQTFLKGKCSPPLENRPQAPARGGELALCVQVYRKNMLKQISKQKVNWPCAGKNCKDLQNKKVYLNHLCHSHLANNVLVEKAVIPIFRLFPHRVPRTHLDKCNSPKDFFSFQVSSAFK